MRWGRCRKEDSIGKRRQVLLVVATSLLPPGLTCPGTAQVCSGAGRDFTNVPTAAGEPEGCRGHRWKKPGLWPPWVASLYGLQSWAEPHPVPLLPHPLASHTLPPGEIQELQDLGLFTDLFASLGKSRTQGLSHIKSRRAARALQQRLIAQGLGDWREGVHTAAWGHFREGLSFHH